MGKSKKAAGSAKKRKKKSIKAADPRKKRLILFVVSFLVILVIGAILYPYFSISMAEELRGFMAVTATVCGGILDIFSDDINFSDRYLTFKGFSVEIIEECTGIFEMLIFLAALLSYPATWRSKLIGVLLGLPALYLFNVTRIVFLTVVGVYYRNLFEFMHLYFWQATLILMITTVWVLWILLVVSREEKSADILS
jgi:exosortase H (IPTLxxWG-CTERM-specific)